MYLLVSGEGPTDIGSGDRGMPCEGEAFCKGPLTLMLLTMIDQYVNYDFSLNDRVGFVHKTGLKGLAEQLKSPAKSKLALPGANRPKETRYFFDDARALAALAQRLATEKDDDVIAVLFHDSDGTQSSQKTLWADKWNSIEDGFFYENFEWGIPMVPKPKSEAWILCAAKENPYQHCQNLEMESGNDAAENNLKDQLEIALKGTSLDDFVQSQAFTWNRIDMKSFSRFNAALADVLRKAHGPLVQIQCP